MKDPVEKYMRRLRKKAMRISKEQYFMLRRVLYDIGVNFVVTYESEDIFIRMLNDGLFRIKENELFSDKGNNM